MTMAIPVINLFAGAGGIAEGFCPVAESPRRFYVALTVEKSAITCETLRLRNFCRQFPAGELPDAYYRVLRREMPVESLWTLYPAEAEIAAWITRQAELGNPDSCPEEALDRLIRESLNGEDCWVLIGGPPCQAYSTAGRSRNLGNPSYETERDPRFFLYREYLRVLAKHVPAAFVLENVTGLLSAKAGKKPIFPHMIEELAWPSAAVQHLGRSKSSYRYRLYALEGNELMEGGDPRRLIIKSENFGIPQTRHRVIIIGIREDMKGAPCLMAQRPEPPTGAGLVIAGLPRLRSGLSRNRDSEVAWKAVLREALSSDWLKEASNTAGDSLRIAVTEAVERACSESLNQGSDFIPCSEGTFSKWRFRWYEDPLLKGVLNHISKSHMPTDLHRYLFSAAYTAVVGRIPALRDFPEQLLPAHRNAKSDKFQDRFRVQQSELPAKTITSHLSQDGHYFIHPDASQCRSLTVREAARIQTFPDNYLFLGNRSEQYIQVGNAVPPLLGKIAAEQVFAALC